MMHYEHEPCTRTSVSTAEPAPLPWSDPPGPACSSGSWGESPPCTQQTRCRGVCTDLEGMAGLDTEPHRAGRPLAAMTREDTTHRIVLCIRLLASDPVMDFLLLIDLSSFGASSRPSCRSRGALGLLPASPLPGGCWPHPLRGPRPRAGQSNSRGRCHPLEMVSATMPDVPRQGSPPGVKCPAEHSALPKVLGGLLVSTWPLPLCDWSTAVPGTCRWRPLC